MKPNRLFGVSVESSQSHTVIAHTPSSLLFPLSQHLAMAETLFAPNVPVEPVEPRPPISFRFIPWTENCDDNPSFFLPAQIPAPRTFTAQPLDAALLRPSLAAADAVDAARMRLLHLIHAATLQFHGTHHRLPDSARFPADAELLLHCVHQLSAATAWEGDCGKYYGPRQTWNLSTWTKRL